MDSAPALVWVLFPCLFCEVDTCWLYLTHTNAMCMWGVTVTCEQGYYKGASCGLPLSLNKSLSQCQVKTWERSFTLYLNCLWHKFSQISHICHIGCCVWKVMPQFVFVFFLNYSSVPSMFPQAPLHWMDRLPPQYASTCCWRLLKYHNSLCHFALPDKHGFSRLSCTRTFWRGESNCSACLGTFCAPVIEMWGQRTSLVYTQDHNHLSLINKSAILLVLSPQSLEHHPKQNYAVLSLLNQRA